jgi:hypothetical protein
MTLPTPTRVTLEDRVTALERQVQQLNKDIDACLARDRALLVRLKGRRATITTNSTKYQPQRRSSKTGKTKMIPLVPSASMVLLSSSPSDMTDQAVFGIVEDSNDDDDDDDEEVKSQDSEKHTRQQWYTLEQRDDVELANQKRGM